MKREIVVAKFKEDVTWTSKSPWPVIVYDKHKDDNRPHSPQVRYEDLSENPLSGRESHSYVYHILKNYNNLADITFFVQGRPFDHCPHFQDTLFHNYTDSVGLGMPSHGGVVVKNTYTLDYKGPPFPWKLSVIKASAYLQNKWKFLFPNHDPLSEYVYVWGQQYAVPKWRILQRPYSFYERIYQELCQHKCHKELKSDAYSLELLMHYVVGDEWKNGYPDKLRGFSPKCMA